MSAPVVLFGEVLFDAFEGSTPVMGGAPFNVAWHLCAFGEDPLLVTAVGDDEAGHRIIREMKKWGLSTEHVQLWPDHPTGIVEVKLADGEPIYDIKAKVAYDFIEADNLPALCENGLLYHGTLALRCPVSRHCCEVLRGGLRGKRFIDVNLRSPWWDRQSVIEFLEFGMCVKMNVDELQSLTETGASQVQDTEAIAALAREFKQNHNIVNLLLTRGAQGSLVIGGDGKVDTLSLRSFHSKLVDSVGAGDAFTAVAILGLQRGWEWPVTLERAHQFANLIVSQHGAICPHKKVYEDFSELWHLH